MKNSDFEPQTDLLSLWKNQPPIIRWWFTFSGISIMAAYLMLLIQV